MMKARVTIGASVVELEGEPEEISAAILKLNTSSGNSGRHRALKSGLREIYKEGYFLRPKALWQIREELVKRQVGFGQTSLFPALYKEFLQNNLLGRQGKRGNFRYYCKPEDLKGFK
jgi:hypothetical protein